MRRFIVHEYPQRPCDFPHVSFVGDYKELVHRNPDDEELNIFLNTHTGAFLRAMVAKIPPLLELHLRQTPANFTSSKSLFRNVFARHFDDLRNQRPTLAVDNTKRNLS